jgi:hypothetical protein
VTRTQALWMSGLKVASSAVRGGDRRTECVVLAAVGRRQHGSAQTPLVPRGGPSTALGRMRCLTSKAVSSSAESSVRFSSCIAPEIRSLQRIRKGHGMRIGTTPSHLTAGQRSAPQTAE